MKTAILNNLPFALASTFAVVVIAMISAYGIPSV